jgi:hypothetical protein
MTDLQRPTAPAPQGPTDTVREEAQNAASTAVEGGRLTASAAVDSGSQVASSAADGARNVAAEAAQQVTEVTQQASEQARQLAQRAQAELREQASSQTQRAAGGLRDLGQQFRGLAEGEGTSGFAADVARQLGGNVEQLAGRLEDRGFDGTLEDVRRFASRRPGVFLLGAAAAGFGAVRLGRGLQTANQQQASSQQAGPPLSSPATPSSAGGPAGAV